MPTLTDTRIKALKPTEKNQYLFDSGGMFLLVTTKGQKWWRFKYRYQGKGKTLSLGVYPEVSLKQARIERDKCKALLKGDIDPSAERKKAKAKKAKTQQETTIMSMNPTIKYSFICFDDELSESLFDTREEAAKAGFEQNPCAAHIEIIELEEHAMIDCIVSEFYSDIQDGTIQEAIADTLIKVIGDPIHIFKGYGPNIKDLSDLVLEWMSKETVLILVDEPKIVYRPTTKKNVFQRLNNFVNRISGENP